MDLCLAHCHPELDCRLPKTWEFRTVSLLPEGGLLVTFIAKPRPSHRDEESPIEELPVEQCSANSTQSLLSRSAALEPDAIFRLGFLNSLIPLYIFDLETLKFLEVND